MTVVVGLFIFIEGVKLGVMPLAVELGTHLPRQLPLAGALHVHASAAHAQGTVCKATCAARVHRTHTVYSSIHPACKPHASSLQHHAIPSLQPYASLGVLVVVFVLGCGATLAEPAMGALRHLGSLISYRRSPLLKTMLSTYSAQAQQL